MGVLRCDRGDCETIMCDRYSSRYGYLCHSCMEDLRNSTGVNIEEFMETNPDGMTVDKKSAWEEYVNTIFPFRDY